MKSSFEGAVGKVARLPKSGSRASHAAAPEDHEVIPLGNPFGTSRPREMGDGFDKLKVNESTRMKIETPKGDIIISRRSFLPAMIYLLAEAPIR